MGKRNRKGLSRQFLAMIMAVVMIISTSACAKGTGTPSAAKGDSVLNPLVVERGQTPEVMRPVNRGASLAVQQYIYARLKTEAFLTADFKAMDPAELTAMVDELVGLWDTSQLITSSTENMADQALGKLAGVDLPYRADASNTEKLMMQLASETAAYQAIPMLANGDDRYAAVMTSGNAAQKWAESLTAQYDAIKGAQTIKQLANQLGTDAKAAYKQLVLAQEIIHKGAMSDADAYDNLMKAAQATKTACKVGLFITATVASGGGTLSALAGSSVTLAQGGAVIVGGADCIVDVASTGSTILLGENHQVTVGFDEVKSVLAPVSAVVGLATFNPAETGEQLAYIGDTLTDWFSDGKILGIKVKNSDKGIVIEGEAVDVLEKSKESISSELKTKGFTVSDQPSSRTVGAASAEEIKKVAITNEQAIAILDTLVSELASVLEKVNEAVSDTAAPATASGAAVPFPVIIKSVAGSEWVICLKRISDESFIATENRLDYDSFAVQPNGERREDLSLFNQTAHYVGDFKKVSETSFSGVVYLAAGEVPKEEIGINSVVTVEQTLFITGEYGMPITIQWDGAQFSQVK